MPGTCCTASACIHCEVRAWRHRNAQLCFCLSGTHDTLTASMGAICFDTPLYSPSQATVTAIECFVAAHLCDGPVHCIAGVQVRQQVAHWSLASPPLFTTCAASFRLTAETKLTWCCSHLTCVKCSCAIVAESGKLASCAQSRCYAANSFCVRLYARQFDLESATQRR